MKTLRIILLSSLLACTACTPAPGPSGQEQPATPTGWTVRDNAVKGMHFALPADWVADTSVGSAVRYNGAGLVLTISMADTPAGTLDDYLQKLDTDQATGYEGQSSVKNISKERGAIGGQESELRVQEMLAAGMQSQVAYTVKSGKAYGFMLYSDTGTAPTKENISFFKQFLSTVAFK